MLKSAGRGIPSLIPQRSTRHQPRDSSHPGAFSKLVAARGPRPTIEMRSDASRPVSPTFQPPPRPTSAFHPLNSQQPIGFASLRFAAALNSQPNKKTGRSGLQSGRPFPPGCGAIKPPVPGCSRSCPACPRGGGTAGRDPASVPRSPRASCACSGDTPPARARTSPPSPQ